MACKQLAEQAYILIWSGTKRMDGDFRDEILKMVIVIRKSD